MIQLETLKDKCLADSITFMVREGGDIHKLVDEEHAEMWHGSGKPNIKEHPDYKKK